MHHTQRATYLYLPCPLLVPFVIEDKTRRVHGTINVETVCAFREHFSVNLIQYVHAC